MATETLPYTRHSRVDGRSVDIDCPFCGATVTAYLWSLAGSGKRCPCGAKFDYWGNAHA